MSYPGDREREEAEWPARRADSGDIGSEDEQPVHELPPGAEATVEEQLKAELEEALREREQFRVLAQRTQADFSNFRRRAEGERDELERKASANVLLRLFPILDDLERAIKQAPEGEDIPWMEGVRLIGKKFQSFLEEAGVQTVEPLGKPFDPWEHEVVAYQEAQGQPDGCVIGVVAQGYKLHGRVLRPAHVVVAKGTSSGNPAIDLETSVEREANDYG